MRKLFRHLIALAAFAAAPAAAQQASSAPEAQQRPTHLVLFNKPGPNFARLSEMRQQALVHRQIYLDLTAKGDIIASGRLEGEPVLGLIIFRQGVDEQEIRRRLADDALIRSGVLSLEFRRWTIQMGGLGPRRAAN